MKPKKEPRPAQAAARERMAKCSRNGRTPRPAGSSRKIANWPKFWSACNTRLKAEDEGVGASPELSLSSRGLRQETPVALESIST